MNDYQFPRTDPVAPEANLVAGMKWLQGTYTQRDNRQHGVSALL
jgi:hypothetical protein